MKTRLQPDFSAEQSASLHRAFVHDMLEMLSGMAPVADLELHTDIDTDAWRGLAVARRLQADGDLGSRMLHTLSDGIAMGRTKVMIVGSDVPTLPAAHLAELLHLDCDVALGPTEDGGYYAISCRVAHPAMFEGVAWSGPRVLEDTIWAAEACGLTVGTGKTWFDIDTAKDLHRLAGSPAIPPHTHGWLLQNAKHLLREIDTP